MTAGKTTAQVFGLFGLLATAISLGFTAADVAAQEVAPKVMGAGRILLPAFQGPPSAVHGYIVERSMPVFERLSSELRKADTKEEAKQWLESCATNWSTMN